MPDPEKFVRPKEEMRISAASWNNLMLMMRDYNRGGRQGRKILGGKQRSLLKSNLEVYVQNLTGGPWDDLYKVVRLSNALLPITQDSLGGYNKEPILGAFAPIEETDAIAITQRPSTSSPSSGLIVPAVILGVTLCKVRMLESSHQWANPVSGEIDFLESSAECGQARILYHEAEDSGDFSLAIVNLIGANPCETTDSGGGPPNYEAGGPGWVAGLCADNCLKMRVMSAYGLCGAIDVSQVIPLTGDGAVWNSVCDFRYCDSTPGSDDPECTGIGPVTFTRNSGGMPSASIDGISLIYNAAGRSGGVAWIEFAGGQDLCAGCPELVEVSGPCGPEEEPGDNCCGANAGCGSNYFVVRFECANCPVSGWDCPAWYCTSVGCCEESIPEPLFVDADLAMSDNPPRICSGPYETEEEALAVCGPFECDGFTPSGNPSCSTGASKPITPIPGTYDWCFSGGTPFPAIDPTEDRQWFTQQGFTGGRHLEITIVDPQPGQSITFYEDCNVFGDDGEPPILAMADESNPHIEWDVVAGGGIFIVAKRSFGDTSDFKVRVSATVP